MDHDQVRLDGGHVVAVRGLATSVRCSCTSARFPAEVFGCLLPWSLLIPAAFVPAVRRALAGNDAVAFSGIVLLGCDPDVLDSTRRADALPRRGLSLLRCAGWCARGSRRDSGNRRRDVAAYMLGGERARRAWSRRRGWWERGYCAALSLERVTLPAGPRHVYATMLDGFALAIARLRQYSQPGGIVAGRGRGGTGVRGACHRRA